ncbi:hypothetical protein [Geobacter sp.]|uniref:hypothetical protein n=1 Tax=Geobacter sp. TaxID=46610 RepID=UPI0027BB097A|nr:hypothetical protein [Geobacter sp.]
MSPDYLTISFPPLEDFSSPLLLSGFGMEEFLLVFFAGVGTMAVVCQLVPGVLLLISMVRSMFFCTRTDMAPSVEGGE